MRPISRQDGFTLTELLIASTVTLLVLGGAMTAFKNALAVNDTASQLSDSNQNLRSGSNLLVHDLMQAGRKIPTGGIPIPSGAGATAINRPSPPGVSVYAFDNINQTTLTAIVSGANLGPTIDNSSTDIVTFLMIDPLLPALTLYDATANNPPAGVGLIANDGSSMTVGTSNWLTGDSVNGIPAIQAGDLVFFNYGGGAIQTVTSTDATKVYFAANDWFNFNQRANAAAGTVMQLQQGSPLKFPSAMTAYRLLMITYYVDAVTVPGTPRLTKVINHYAPQALAGVVEDLDINYDLVDGVNNPVGVKSLPWTDPVSGLTYTATQIRKVNLHVGVRSDTLCLPANDYLRNHLSTSISIRDLAFVSRYQ